MNIILEERISASDTNVKSFYGEVDMVCVHYIKCPFLDFKIKLMSYSF